jgi:hypothetical protein
MKELVKVLNQLGLDEAGLQSLFERGEEKGYYLAVPGATALDLWQKLRDQIEQTGFWPMLLRDDNALRILRYHEFLVWQLY